MTKIELLQAAKAAFKANPDLTVVHVTEDGECFPVLNDAVNHRSTIGSKEKIITCHVEKVDVMIEALQSANLASGSEKSNENDVVNEKIKSIAACATTEELGAIIIGNDEDALVKRAFGAKMKELKASEKRS